MERLPEGDHELHRRHYRLEKKGSDVSTRRTSMADLPPQPEAAKIAGHERSLGGF